MFYWMFAKKGTWQNGMLCKKREIVYFAVKPLVTRYLSGGICNEIQTTFNYSRRRRVRRRTGEYRILLNRAAKSSTARASARAHRGIPRALFRPREDRQGHAHPDIDSLTASVFARRYHRLRRIRSRIYGEIRILAGTIVRETLRDYPQTTPADCFIFIARQKLLRNFSRESPDSIWKNKGSRAIMR